MNSYPPNFSDSDSDDEDEMSRPTLSDITGTFTSNTTETNHTEKTEQVTPPDFSCDEEIDIIAVESLKDKLINIYHGKNIVQQKHVNSMSAIHIANTVFSASCTKKDMNGNTCLAKLNSDQNLRDGNFKESTQLISLLRGDVMNMSESEKHNYIENMLSPQSRVVGESNRMMIDYRISHPLFKKGIVFLKPKDVGIYEKFM